MVQTIKNIRKSLKLSDEVYHIADSAIYSEDNITELGERTLWITRVPATITEAKDLLGSDIELEACTDARYSYYMTFGYLDFAANLTETKHLHAKAYSVSIRIMDIHCVQYTKTFVKFIHQLRLFRIHLQFNSFLLIGNKSNASKLENRFE